jgi:hypothetical protein
VFENGALKTVTPRSEAASRSIWLVPMQNAPTATRFGAAVEYPPRDVRLRSDAEDGRVPRGPYQFRLVVSPVDVLDGQTGLVQHCCGVRMDVLEQEGSLGSTERIRHNVLRT